MYLHLGNEILIKTKDIVGIFDLEKSSTSKKTKEFLVDVTRKKQVITVSYEMPKSFIVTQDNKKDKKIYISQISTTTLKKRQRV